MCYVTNIKAIHEVLLTVKKYSLGTCYSRSLNRIQKQHLHTIKKLKLIYIILCRLYMKTNDQHKER